VQCPFAFLDSGNSYPLHYERAEPLCRLLRKLNASLILMMRPRVACPCSSCLPSVVDMGTCPEAPRLSARNADRQLCAFISYGSTSQRRAAQCYTNILDICRVCLCISHRGEATPERASGRQVLAMEGPGRSLDDLGGSLDDLGCFSRQVMQLFVHPDFQRKGLGSKLLREAQHPWF